jgi:hypothetical protein
MARERPDFLWDQGHLVVIVEVDEEQHLGRACECEQARMINVSQDLAAPRALSTRTRTLRSSRRLHPARASTPSVGCCSRRSKRRPRHARVGPSSESPSSSLMGLYLLRCCRLTTFWCKRQGMFTYVPGRVRLSSFHDPSASEWWVFLMT